MHLGGCSHQGTGVSAGVDKGRVSVAILNQVVAGQAGQKKRKTRKSGEDWGMGWRQEIGFFRFVMSRPGFTMRFAEPSK